MSSSTTVTVMFTDLAGSTELSVRIGPVRADEFLRQHFEIVRQTLRAHRGEEVKILGDGVMAVFGTVTDGVDCAVALQQAMEAAGRGDPDAPSLRVGLSIGEVTVDEGDYFGTSVVEAARLCAQARPRQILSASFLRRLAGARGKHSFRPLGPLSLKGLPDALEVDEVTWVPLVDRGLVGDFRDVDVADHPARFVGMLDRLRESAFLTGVRNDVLQQLGPLPGERLLDIGCGTGDDVLDLAGLVGADGYALGVDPSETMIDEARRRAAAAGVTNVDLRAGSAEALPLGDDSVDGCRSERVFQYLTEPLRGVREAVRVTRPGGRIVIADTDWDTAVVDHNDGELSARIHRAWSETRPCGGAGRRLYGLCVRAGLQDVTVLPHASVVTELDDRYRTIMTAIAEQAVACGAVTGEEASRWLNGIEAAGDAGRFFRSFTMFVVRGEVPR